MIVTGADDNKSPKETKRVYDLATGPKITGLVVRAKHTLGVRFWYGPMTAFFLTHLEGDAAAEEYVWGDRGIESSPRITGGEHECGGWRSKSSDICR